MRDALHSINMQMEDWQPIWLFDFPREHKAGTTPDEAAMKANRFWWREQNKSVKQDCQKTPGCWLPREHRGGCQPAYEQGDYLKVEFPDEAGIGEWVWVKVDERDDDKQLAYGTLDNQPLNDYAGKIKQGSRLAISYAQIRMHKKASEFTGT
ncbi:MAG: hypothetical protein ACLQBK_11970 [Candidatus Sulfotelmatobacter sp.]